MVDGNPLYKKRARDLCTPDFVIGQDSIGENNPNDFYVDVQEVTGGPWDIKKRKSPLFNKENPVRVASEKLRDLEFGYKNRQRILINENNPELLKAIFKPIHRKSHKYGQRKRQSSKFGLISVQSPIYELDRQVHFNKLRWSVFESIIQLGIKEKDLHVIVDLRNKILTGEKKGLIPITASFKSDTWCFWAILGVNECAGQCIFLINQNGIERYKDEADEVISWINNIGMSKDLIFLKELEEAFNN